MPKFEKGRKIPDKYKSFIITEHLSHIEAEENLSKDQMQRNIFYPTIDRMINELTRRFSINSELLEGISALDPKDPHFLDFDKIKPLAVHYEMNIDTLKNEILILPGIIVTEETEKKIKISSAFQFNAFLEMYKDVFPVTYELSSLSLTIPASSAACEKTFSSMKRVKDYLRNSMSDERLHDLGILYIERKMAKVLELDLEKVVEKFAEIHKNCRIILY